jgi:hypothetical protein
MSWIITIFFWIAAICTAATGDFGGAFWVLVGWGITLFVWQAVVDAAKQVTGSFPREQYNLTQNKYEISESDDPTKPNENIPAVIEIGRHYKRKP